MTRMPWVFPAFLRPPGAVRILVLRLVVGTAMMFHGWPKIRRATSWMGPKARVPGVFQTFAALAEVGGGFRRVLGLLTPLASCLILGAMAVALGRSIRPKAIRSWHHGRADPASNWPPGIWPSRWPSCCSARVDCASMHGSI